MAYDSGCCFGNQAIKEEKWITTILPIPIITIITITMISIIIITTAMITINSSIIIREIFINSHLTRIISLVTAIRSWNHQ